MDRNYIDVSIGLHFALELLKSYRENGLLQAPVSHLPGISGKCEVVITIVQGEVISCIAKDKKGYTHNADLQLLLKLDRDRGPFEWNLFSYKPQVKIGTSEQHLSTVLSGQPEQSTMLTQMSSPSPKPRKIALLKLNLLIGWSPEQKRALFMVYELVDGKRTIEEIKQAISFSPQKVEEGLRILISMNVITFSV